MRKAFASVDDMLALECYVCKTARRNRCRVRRSENNDMRHTEPPFTEAPYVVPYNMPKYFAQQLRALQFAQSARLPQQLFWIVARDTPYLGDIKNLKGVELAKREAQWLQKHDQATQGIMVFSCHTTGARKIHSHGEQEAQDLQEYSRHTRELGIASSRCAIIARTTGARNYTEADAPKTLYTNSRSYLGVFQCF